MNHHYEHLRRQILVVLHNVEPKDDETISHALMGLIISMPADEIHKAGEREPRIRIPNENRTDGWKERIQRNWSSSNDEEIGR